MGGVVVEDKAKEVLDRPRGLAQAARHERREGRILRVPSEGLSGVLRALQGPLRLAVGDERKRETSPSGLLRSTGSARSTSSRKALMASSPAGSSAASTGARRSKRCGTPRSSRRKWRSECSPAPPSHLAT